MARLKDSKWVLPLFMSLVVPVGAAASDAFIVSSGMLAVDADDTREQGLTIQDAAGNVLGGVVVLRAGLSLVDAAGRTYVVESSPTALAAFDTTGDGAIDAADPHWEAMFLAVDYNRDAAITKGEYALIGKCGVDSLHLHLAEGRATSKHTNGSTRDVGLPD